MYIRVLIHGAVPVFESPPMLFQTLSFRAGEAKQSHQQCIHKSVHNGANNKNKKYSTRHIIGELSEPKILAKNWRNPLCCTNHPVHLRPSSTDPIRHCFPPVEDPPLPL